MNKDWYTYIENISWAHKDKVISTWKNLIATVPNIRIPYAGLSPDEKSFFFVWDNGKHHIELEICVESYEWFYRNRATEHIDGSNAPITNITEEFLQYLRKYGI